MNDRERERKRDKKLACMNDREREREIKSLCV